MNHKGASQTGRPERRFVVPRQAARLKIRRTAASQRVRVVGTEFIVDPGVYDCGGDTALMIETVQISKQEVFLDVGCGAGAVSVCLGSMSAGGLGVDINAAAVRNAAANAVKHGIRNVTFRCSDVFDAVVERFDVVVCNPPYTPHVAVDSVERMFWDPANGMTRRMFKGVRQRLCSGGRLYFGWCDFPEMDIDLPVKLARDAGLRCDLMTSKVMRGGDYSYLVYQFS